MLCTKRAIEIERNRTIQTVFRWIEFYTLCSVYWACWCCEVIENGVDPDDVNAFNKTALHVAAFSDSSASRKC